MELAPGKEPWTAAVAWARPWHRPASRQPSATAPRKRVRGAPALPDALLDTVGETAWTEAVAELQAARAALVLLPPDVDDPWLEAVARQQLFRARRKVGLAQEALTGAPADLPWSTC